MKNLSLFFLTALAAVVTLSSCNDSDGDLPRNRAFAKVITLENNEYYFALDDAKTLYPSDKRRIGAYQATDGQRVIVYFNFLDPKVEGYDHNIAPYGVDDILTKDMKTVTTQEDLEKIGDDLLNLDGSRIAGGFLTLEFSLMSWSGSKHEMNLIINQVETPGETLEGYTNLELHQKASSAQPGYAQYSPYNLVAFRLGELDPAISGSKGFYVRIKNLNGNVEYIKIDAPAKI